MEQLDRLMGWLEKLAEKLGMTVEQLAPHAFSYARWCGVGKLVVALALLVGAGWFCRAGRNIWGWARSDAGRVWKKTADVEVSHAPRVADFEVGAILLQLMALGCFGVAARFFMGGFPAVVDPVGATIHNILAN